MNTLYICLPHLSDVVALPWEIKKKSTILLRLYIIYVKQIATVLLQLSCLFTVVWCFLLSA